MTRQAYGSGSMTEREPGLWRLRVMVDGKQVQRTFRGSKAAATKELAKLGGQPPTPGRVTTSEPVSAKGVRTFGDLLTKWLAHARARGRAPKTLDEARREIENRIRPRLGHIPIDQLGAEELDDAYSAWLAEGLAPSTVHRHAAVISAALSQGVRWKWLNARDNPALSATPPSATSKRRLVTPTPEQVAKLIRAAEADDPVMAAAVALAFVTGARRGELCALRWDDIEFALVPDPADEDAEAEMAVVRIERSLSQVGHELVEKSTKTGRGRSFLVDARAAALIRRHQDWQRDLSVRADSPLVENPYVLSDNANAGRPMPPSMITDRFTKLRGRAKVRGVRFHDLRHANVTQLLGAGVDAATVASRVGHASTKMTLDRYGHALPAGGEAAAAVMGALLP